SVLLLFAGLILLNGVLLYIQENNRSFEYEPSDYRELVESVQGLSNEEVLEKLKRSSDELRFFMDLTISDNRLIGSSEEELEERYKHLDISEWIDKYNSGNYLTFTDSIWKERNLIEQALREMQAVTG